MSAACTKLKMFLSFLVTCYWLRIVSQCLLLWLCFWHVGLWRVARHRRSLEHGISYCPIWYHIFKLAYMISYAIIYIYIWYHSCKSMKSYVYDIICWNYDIIFMDLWYHVYDFVPFIICLWYHVLETMTSYLQTKDIYTLLHILYQMFMIACVGTVIS